MKATRSYKKRGRTDCPIATGRYTQGRYLPPKPHWHPEVEIAYIENGHITCVLEDRELHLSAGDILILAPEQTHLYQSPSADADIRFLIFALDDLTVPNPTPFQQEFAQPLKEGVLELPQLLQCGHPAYDRVVSEFSKSDMLSTGDPHYKINRYCSVVVICTALLPWCKQNKNILPIRTDRNSPVHSATVYIHNRYYQPMTLKKIADAVHLNPNYLSTLFRSETGQTVTQYLNRTRIEAAMYLLRNSNLNISQIAEKSGFRSESAFYHQFQKLMGTSPRAFRQANPASHTNQDS